MTPLLIASVVLAFAGCSDWPDVPDATNGAATGPWPTLLPMSEIAVAPNGQADELAAFGSIDARAARLRQRAAILRGPVTDQASFDRLRARLSN